MHITEYHGSPLTVDHLYEYETNASFNLVQKNVKKQGFFKSINIKKFFWEVFLPQGYPESVSEDYLTYQKWDTIQAFCSSITGTLATHAVLKGSGVGDSTATAASATITWLLKDGTGMVGKIAFAYYKGTSLDSNAKQWRLFADVLNDFAIFVQLLLPLFPKQYFTLMMCLAGLAFSLVGVAGGCTRAALTMHQARRNNMADVSAKDGSQETLVNLIALISNLIITPAVSGRPWITWTLFFLFSYMHIYANYRAVKCVKMNLLNRTRLFYTIKVFVSKHKQISTPFQANQAEAVFFPPDFSWLKLGCKLEELKLTREELEKQLSLKSHSQLPKYLIKMDWKSGVVRIALTHGITMEDMVKACFHAYLMHSSILAHLPSYKDFIEGIKQAGWNLEINQLCPEEWRWIGDKATKLHLSSKDPQKIV